MFKICLQYLECTVEFCWELEGLGWGLVGLGQKEEEKEEKGEQEEDFVMHWIVIYD